MTDLIVGPLTLKIHGYANDISGDFYKSNWLLVGVSCATDQGAVAFKSPCLMTTDFFDFVEETQELLTGKGRQAFLVSLEPQIDVRLERGTGADAFVLDVELTPDANDDEDIYDLSTQVSRAQIDSMIAQAKQIIVAFPVRGEDDA